MTRRHIAIAVPALVLVALGVRLGRDRHPPVPERIPDRVPESSATGAPPAADSTGPSREARLARLDASLRAIQDGDSLARRDRWDPAYVVSAVGREPERLLAWMRDSTEWIPYLGRLRGPTGVLMDRQGNSLDRALLLAALLREAGQTVRLAHGQRSREQAADLLPMLLAPRSAPDSMIVQPSLPASGTLHATAAKYRLDGEAIRRGIESQDSAVTSFVAQLDGRVADQSRRLLAQFGAGDSLAEWRARYERALTALEDHWWVQRQEGDRWIDLDLQADLADPGADSVVPAMETIAPGELPASVEHELAIRVVGERWSGGTLTERVALEGALRPADLYGRTIVLQGWPGQWPAQLHSNPSSKLGLRGAALEQHDWALVLLAGDSVVGQGTLYDDGGEGRPDGGGGLGGLGGGIAAMAQRPSAATASSSQLTAAWIEFELREPGEPRRVVRRAVFDLIGPAARAAGAPAQLALSDSMRLTRSLALMVRTEILPVTARLAPEYVTHLAARSVVANAEVLRSILAADPARLPDPDTLVDQARPALSPLYSLATARLEWSPVRDRVYVDRLGVLTTHRHPAVVSGGFGLRGSTEVVAGELGVPLMEPNALEIRLRQGVFDTNAEAFWWPGAHVRNTGEAYQSAQGWVALTAGSPAVGSLQLPADARVRIAQALDSGLVVVTPTAPAGAERYVGWWRLDPRTGVTRGVVGSGWGQCQEYAQLLKSAVIAAAKNMLLDYAMCQGLELGINEIRGRVLELQAQGKLTWAGNVTYRSPTSVAQENHRNCVYLAITSGVLATLPIILKVRQVYKMRAALAKSMARRRAMAAERRAWVEATRRAAPKPLPRMPRFVREAQEAAIDAGRKRTAARTAFDRYKATGNPSKAVLDQLAEAERQAMAEEVEAMETLYEARREAGRPAPPRTTRPSDLKGTEPDLQNKIGEADKTIRDFDKEFAEELLQLGFGGVLGR